SRGRRAGCRAACARRRARRAGAPARRRPSPRSPSRRPRPSRRSAARGSRRRATSRRLGERCVPTSPRRACGGSSRRCSTRGSSRPGSPWWASAPSRGRITLGGLLVFVTYVGKLYGPARGVGGFVATAHAAAAGAERLAELFDLAVIREAPGARALPAPRGRVTFEAVTYRYPGAAEDALSAVSFEVAPGELLAVVGANGAGKSTLARLLLRLVEPSAGRILLDGVDVRELTLASLRGAIALVPQDASLFHATIRENIAYGRDGASPADVERAAWAAHAHAFVRRLPHG